MILVLGGTSDARLLAGELRAAGYDALLSVVGEYGARLAAADGIAVRSGALDEASLGRLFADAEAIVDATHPFAEEISRLALAAAGRQQRALLRYERPDDELPEGVVNVADAAAAATLAVERAGGGTIFVTVGGKTLATYVTAARAAGLRLVARVLPTVESLQACATAGLEPGDVIAMQGPTSAGLDGALLRHLGATVLVTKQSGALGGLNEKLQAAQLAGATAIVVVRPTGATIGLDGDRDRVESAATTTLVTTSVTTPKEVLNWLAALGLAPSCPPVVAAAGSARRLPRGLLQVYTGDGKGKTTAAVGLALRARGVGLAVVFVQFVKGGRESAELALLRAAGVEVVRPATVRSGLLRGAPTSEDRAAATTAWAAARTALGRDDCDLLVLDELHAALRHGLVDLSEVLVCLAGRPAHLEVVTTGRGAPAGLIDQADLVTEMVARRHAYPGVPARRGVEF